MRPMTEFDPDRTCRVHDRVNDMMRDWHTGWARNYRQYAKTDKVDGTVWWNGLVLDGWAIDAEDDPPRSSRTGKRLPNRRSPFP
jgi:hypothetical protein